jgi:hypothetical protein
MCSHRWVGRVAALASSQHEDVLCHYDSLETV